MRHPAPWLAGLALVLAAGPAAAQQTLADQYLYSGELDKGEKALTAHLKKNPGDDEARFGLGVVQFFQTFQHLGQSLYEYGLRTEDSTNFGRQAVREMFPQNRKPKTIAYEDVRRILKTWCDDLSEAEATLAKVKSADVKMPLRPGLIKVQAWGGGKLLTAPQVMGFLGMNFPRDQVNGFVIKFDRGDVHWLRGYCHFLAACGDVLLAFDGHEIFESTAHLVFDRVDTPHKFLTEDRVAFDEIRGTWRDFPPVIDAVTGFHLMLRYELEEPARLKSALKHLEGMVANAREMWDWYTAEEDDDHEWIPNTEQKGVLQIPVRKEMIDTWLATLEETDQILQGKKLVPFWRGQPGQRGLNVRRIFTEPRTVDFVRWVQGTAATPYLEEGEITQFADPQTLQRMNRVFGGPNNFFFFAFWSN